MSGEDPIEDDWKIVRPVRHDPDEEPPTPVGITPSYVWVSFSYRGSEVPGRVRVEVPTTKSRIQVPGRSIRVPEEVYLVKTFASEYLNGQEYVVDQLNLYLTETGKRPVAIASGSHMPTFTVYPRDTQLAFIIDGPGKLTVLQPSSRESFDNDGRAERVFEWEAAPWTQGVSTSGAQ